ncbi:glycosyltransferase family 39 protein [Simiduia sp. 21SJ11W-1]|uniref:glycosyltransferase family 39 protein n=1 Tax=Simiduia sp. 21SJ11W-1 TaxID=2909669 RepID=UPI00209D2198|nr:glycosyltransferase family 39 protein [Simiduia sp. 21SJ11W-1]UTA49053.1 glycosyltransferase family 39 protein [Simiduia sp. 21SJ11W-1]
MQFPFRWLNLSSAPFILLALFVCAHWALAPVLGLGVDEAHYALYGQRPDWSYYDHPPMVGWLHWLGLLLGESEFFVRLPALVLWPLILLLVWRQARRWYGALGVANLALAMLVFSPIVAVLGFGLVPDTPLIVAALLLVALVDKIDATDGRILWHWLALGVLLGLAGLSKYTAVFIAIALLAGLVMRRRWHWLKAPGPWLAVVIAALMVAPVFYWNWAHDWLSFTYQVNHGAEGDWSLLDSLRYVLVLVVSYGPLLALAALCALVRAEGMPASLGRLVCHWLAVVLLLVAVWSAGNGENLPHWTVLSWVLLAPAAANWLYGRLLLGKRLFALVTGGLSVALCLLLWWLLVAPPLAIWPQSAAAVRDLHGWPEGAERARALQAEWAAEEGQQAQLWVANWTQGSRLAWYANAPVQVVSSRPSQFLLWWGEPQAPGLLVRAERKRPKRLAAKAPAGVTCKLVDELDYQREGVTLNHFLYYRCVPAAETGARAVKETR